MGKEKYDLLAKAIVGIANPTGITETCCVSAVEMSGCKTAVVSGAYYALLDTVIHGKTGLLGRGVDDLADNICKCLESPELAKKLGQAGYERVLEQYDFSVVIPKWVELFSRLQEGKVPTAPGNLRNIFYHYKSIRLLNYALQQTLGRLIPWPSIFEMQVFIHGFLRRFESFIMQEKKAGHR